MAVIIGIDPGSRITGYGIIKSDGNKNEYITSGCINASKGDFFRRLKQIFNEISLIITTYNPDESAIEQVFLHANPNSALKLGHARGAAVLALAEQNLPINEYSARQIKQAVVGYGSADKSQVQYMIKMLLKIKDDIKEDAADALAAALCHAHTIGRQGVLR